MKLTDLSDDDLVSSLKSICGEGQRVLARIVECLGEVEERGLHLKAACSSLFDYCVRRLGMSEGEAFRRINAARLVRRFPSLLGRIELGEVHISNLVYLREHLNEGNCEELITAAANMSKREVQEFLARRFPKPDAPTLIRRVPSKDGAVSSTPSLSLPTLPLGWRGASSSNRKPTVLPLSETRYKVQVTVSSETRAKIDRATELMRHRNPSGDLAVILEVGLDLLIAKLEKERLGKTSRPQKKARPAKVGHVTSAVRREVFERDGEQCTFVSAGGDRCRSRSFLEIDHVHPRALGGTGDAANLRVRCRAHNLHHAKQVFGRDHVQERIYLRQHKSIASAPPAVILNPEPVAAPPHGTGPTSDGAPRTARQDERSSFETAARGLVNLGFRQSEAQRALGIIREDHPHPNGLTTELVIREALRVLT